MLKLYMLHHRWHGPMLALTGAAWGAFVQGS